MHPAHVEHTMAIAQLSSEELAKEQEYVSMLYSRLDALRGGATNRLARVLPILMGS